MGIEFIGGSVDLSAGGTGDITLEYARDGEIREILLFSTGRVEISNFEQEAVERYLTGRIEFEQLKKQGNVYILPEPIKYTAGVKLLLSLIDISNTVNKVYCGMVLIY